ncbi:zona pellucida sperm-binding protein 3-like [Lampris incognitus]|uniref:zona pellucida sperm-binding protein 3-like n=1 Tax=Lampris incognitus TaxID=2546036 RepID=UPI0024B56954|nr:zona pellucida sperm-binding protein 3-like [Lampris incognitus]
MDPSIGFDDLEFSQQTIRTVVVKCHEDSIEVTVRADLFGLGLPVEPKHLSLGPADDQQDSCRVAVSEGGLHAIRAPLNGCGTKVMLTEDAVVYTNVLLYNPVPLSRDAVYMEGASIPVRCEYGRRYSVSSSALRPTWSSLTATQATHLDLDFHLRLKTGDWSRERQSSVYYLGDMVNMEASVDVGNHLPLSLYADRCVATLAPDVNTLPRYSFIDHNGCFIDSQLSGFGSRFLPRVRDEVLQIQFQPFLFHQDVRNNIYITCYLVAVPISKKDPVKKACSYIDGRWRSVDDDDSICESCGRQEETSHTIGAKPAAHHTDQRGTLTRRSLDTRWELHEMMTTLGPLVFLPLTSWKTWKPHVAQLENKRIK